MAKELVVGFGHVGVNPAVIVDTQMENKSLKSWPRDSVIFGGGVQRFQCGNC